MKKTNIQIIPGILQGKVEAPPSKSITHRLLIIGALSSKECTIHNPLFCEDTEITLQGLVKLGYVFEVSQDSILFTGYRENVNKPVEIFVGNSGTSARFLTALASFLPGDCVIDGVSRMRQRPMSPLIQALQKMGADIEHNSGYLPLRIKGGYLTGGRVIVDSTYSSQFLSAMLLIAPYLDQVSRIHFGNFTASKPYVDMTIALMRKAGITIEKHSNYYEVAALQRYSLGRMKVEGDYSNAAVFMVGATISGGRITLKNLLPNSIQGDRTILDILEATGTKIDVKHHEVLVARTQHEISSIQWNMKNCPDLIPPVSVVALFANGKSILRNVSNLRIKESDRLQAIMNNIEKLGGKAYLDGNDLIIEPQPLHAAMLPTYKDHRIAMSFAMAGLKIPGIAIENSECVKKSYPNFWDDFKLLIK